MFCLHTSMQQLHCCCHNSMHSACVHFLFTSCRLSRPPPHLSVLASILPRVVLPVPIMPMR